MNIPIGIRKDNNVTASALFGVATLLIFWGAAGWFIFSGELNWLGMLLCSSGVIYIVLGILARWRQLTAALLGIILYAAFLIFECYLSINDGVDLVLAGLFFKIPIGILLVAAVSPLRCSMSHKAVITSLAVAFVVSLGFLAHALWLNSLWKAEVSVQAVYDGSEQAKRDFYNGRLRLFKFYGENREDRFSGQRQGRFEIWYAEYHPSVYVQRVSEERWVEAYNEFMKLLSSFPSNSTPAKAKSGQNHDGHQPGDMLQYHGSALSH